MAAELNFSEFQAIRKRHAREELDDEEEKAEERQQRRTAKRKDAADAKKDDGEDEDDSLRERAGFFAEMHETQLIFALLIVADVPTMPCFPPASHLAPCDINIPRNRDSAVNTYVSIPENIDPTVHI